MRHSDSPSRSTDSELLAAIDLACAEGAESSDHAVIVGDRAGVVEWANAAWSEITGFPASETIQKPITHFLAIAEIELELVDFVGQHFREGRTCVVKFPFETFDHRQIQVHLEVRPIHSERGEVGAFLAVARVENERAAPIEIIEQAPRPGIAAGVGSDSPRLQATAAPSRQRAVPRASLSEAVGRACEAARSQANEKAHFDIGLAADLPEIDCESDDIVRLTRALIDGALTNLTDPWGYLTIVTGRANRNRSHVSQTYPIDAHVPVLARGAHLFLEVHDTGPALDAAALARIRNGTPGDSSRERACADALEICDSIGGSAHLDSRAGCGNQVLFLIPIR